MNILKQIRDIPAGISVKFGYPVEDGDVIQLLGIDDLKHLADRYEKLKAGLEYYANRDNWHHGRAQSLSSDFECEMDDTQHGWTVAEETLKVNRI